MPFLSRANWAIAGYEFGRRFPVVSQDRMNKLKIRFRSGRRDGQFFASPGLAASTIPAVLTIGFISNKAMILGLDATGSILLSLTLVVSILTFTLERTSCWGRCTCYCFSLI